MIFINFWNSFNQFISRIYISPVSAIKPCDWQSKASVIIKSRFCTRIGILIIFILAVWIRTSYQAAIRSILRIWIVCSAVTARISRPMVYLCWPLSSISQQKAFSWRIISEYKIHLILSGIGIRWIIGYICNMQCNHLQSTIISWRAPAVCIVFACWKSPFII